MSKKRFLVSLTMVLVTVWASILGPVLPALAHNTLGWGWCTGYAICTAKDQNGYGNHSFLNTSIGFCRNMPWNDEVTSLDNHIGVPVQFWRDAGCNGGRYQLAASPAPDSTVNNLGGTGFNDTFSSYCVGYINGSVGCGQFLP